MASYYFKEDPTNRNYDSKEKVIRAATKWLVNTPGKIEVNIFQLPTTWHGKVKIRNHFSKEA